MPVNHFGKSPATAAADAVGAASAEKQAQERKEAYAKLSEFVNAANTNLEAATALADKFGLSFHFSAAYGMGGTYYGEDYAKHEGAGWAPSESGWQSSSQSC